MLTLFVTRSFKVGVPSGEQKPLCNESTDTCWQRDRRVDMGFRTGQLTNRIDHSGKTVLGPERQIDDPRDKLARGSLYINAQWCL